MTETPYFKMPVKPYRDGFYKTKDYDGEITMRMYKDGWFGLPDAFVAGWCGLTEKAK